jgi:hypothetical protein
MDDEHQIAPTIEVGSGAELRALPSRREFVRVLGLGGALVLLPGLFSACQDGSNTGGITSPGSGRAVTIDVSAAADVGVLQFAYALEQLEADFYSQVLANFASSSFSDAEKSVLSDIAAHEVVHRDYLKAALTTNANFTLTPTYRTAGLNFSDRVSVLTAARTFEDLGVAAYNGAAQFATDSTNLLILGKITSVEARHAAAIRDLIAPSSGDFAPTPFDDAFSPSKAAESAQAFLVESIRTAVPASTAFVQGPNGNG